MPQHASVPVVTGSAGPDVQIKPDPAMDEVAGIHKAETRSALAQTGTEQPPDHEIVRGITALLQSGGLVAASEANAYVSLWEQLDQFRQRAARCILVDALLWKQDPDAAVKHIRAVLSDNG